MLHQFEEGALSTQLDLFDPVAMTLISSQRDTAIEPDDRIIAGTQMPVVNEELREMKRRLKSLNKTMMVKQ